MFRHDCMEKHAHMDENKFYQDGMHTFGCGTVKWYKDGVAHREDGPATIYPDGTEVWSQNGRLHRADGPAFTRKWGDVNGVRRSGGSWWFKGKMYETLDDYLAANDELSCKRAVVLKHKYG